MENGRNEHPLLGRYVLVFYRMTDGATGITAGTLDWVSADGRSASLADARYLKATDKLRSIIDAMTIALLATEGKTEKRKVAVSPTIPYITLIDHCKEFVVCTKKAAKSIQSAETVE